MEKKSRHELIALCKEKGLKGYSGKKKHDILAMLDHAPATPETPATPEALLSDCLKAHTVKQIATTLNVCVGTINRWIELKNVPPQYTFDLHKILSRPINYSAYSSTLKDQFFTPDAVVTRCWKSFNNALPDINIADYTFIEPSAGNGAFLRILPPGSIGLDIEPRATGIECRDYLQWAPPDTTRKYIVFGNPPFGLRGHLALNFINHSHAFADYVCFILPQLFESDGKGSPRKRVRGYNLVHSESLTAAFYNPENQAIKINGVFQIWSKHTTNPAYTIHAPPTGRMKVFSLSDGGTVATTRNKDMIGKCDIYLPSTCFGKENMRPYNSFEELPGKKGYGIVFTTPADKEAMCQRAKEIDWSSVSFLSTNSAFNLRSSILFAQLA